MPRELKPKTRNSGNWTEAQWTNFIRGNLRKASMKWAPINEAKKAARVSRGVYKCDGCGVEGPASIRDENGKKHNNACVDHIDPIIDPDKGFVSWDDFINKLFCEREDLQVLCHECHTKKTNDERARAAEARKRAKEIGK